MISSFIRLIQFIREFFTRRERDRSLLAIVDAWKNSARSQFRCAQTTTDEMGKRVVDHGACIYANCALELERAIGKTPTKGTTP